MSEGGDSEAGSQKGQGVEDSREVCKLMSDSTFSQAIITLAAEYSCELKVLRKRDFDTGEVHAGQWVIEVYFDDNDPEVCGGDVKIAVDDHDDGGYFTVRSGKGGGLTGFCDSRVENMRMLREVFDGWCAGEYFDGGEYWESVV